MAGASQNIFADLWEEWGATYGKNGCGCESKHRLDAHAEPQLMKGTTHLEPNGRGRGGAGGGEG